MKKYFTLGELLVDFRKHRNLSQLDFAALLEVDGRTVIRWEKNESLMKVEKEKLLIEKFGIPHQVIRNLNTDNPISIYFDFNKWAYSFSFLSSSVPPSSNFKPKTEYDTDRIQNLSKDEDFAFIASIQKNQKNWEPLKTDVIKQAAKILPELNLVIYGQSGFHEGHISILPLKYDSFLQLKNRTKQENQLTVNDLNRDPEQKPLVFYYYSLYSNSQDNTFYLMNKLLSHFKNRKYKEYILAGISYRQTKIDRLTDMGLKLVWEQIIDKESEHYATFLSGNLNEFLFGSPD